MSADQMRDALRTAVALLREDLGAAIEGECVGPPAALDLSCASPAGLAVVIRRLHAVMSAEALVGPCAGGPPWLRALTERRAQLLLAPLNPEPEDVA